MSERTLNRRVFLQASGLLAAGSTLSSFVGCTPGEPRSSAATLAKGTRLVRPFRLDQVRLGEGLFQQKRDRMLHYARRYGGDADIYAGPDRLLSIFRANAGLDTKGAEAVGGWETETGYLRGHYAGHFMSLLAQAWASTGEEIYRKKLDYVVKGLAECQAALAAAAQRATPRVEGRLGRALRLSGSPIGHAEHVRLPGGIVSECRDFTIAVWIKPHLYDEGRLPERKQTPEELLDGSAVFDFGRPNAEYAEAALEFMVLTVRSSNDKPVPRFAITTSGASGEQVLEGREPLAMGEWTHLAVTRSGEVGTLYVNGEAVAVNSAMTLSPADLGVTPDNWLGRRQFPQRTVSYLHADLDEFRILRRALDAGEVRRLVETGEAPLKETVAWYRFDEAEGPTAVDDSGHGRDGSILAPTDGRRHPGFLSAYPETQFIRLEEFATYGARAGIWAPYYTLHKIMAGLLGAHTVAGNERALEVLEGIGDWVVSRVLPLRREQLDRMWNLYIAGEYGGINESLANLHALLPAKDEYLEAAKRFVNNNVYEPTARGEDVLDGRHANQHIPQFMGYLRTFEESGDTDGADAGFYEAARNFWDNVVPHRMYSHGGVGVGEILRQRDVIAGSLYDDENHAETCPLYNLLKLSRQLFFHDPDSKYMNYYELGLFNQILGSRRDVDDAASPLVTYFVPVQPGRRRQYDNIGTCCGGTGLESHTKYQDSIFFRSAEDDTLWVNLYIASTLDWAEKGFTVTLDTRFPLEGTASLTVQGQGLLAIKLRVPVWVGDGYAIHINGEEQPIAAVPGTYVALDREWSLGDRIDVSMPLRFRVEKAIDDPLVQSLYYGPTLLAAQAGPVGDDLESGLLELGLYRHLKLDGDLAAAFTAASEPMHFELDGLMFVPFFEADPVSEEPSDESSAESAGMRHREATQPYHLYLRRTEPTIVFGGVDSGVRNPVGADGVSFLDSIWSRAPFATHEELVKTVEQVARDWQATGELTAAVRARILDAARRAKEAMRV